LTHSTFRSGDRNNWWAAYALWVCSLFGHPDVRLMDGGNPLRTAWRLGTREKLLGLYLVGVAFCVVYATSLNGPDGVIALLDTFLPAGMLCVALHDMAAPQSHRAAAMLQVLFAVNAALTLVEAISGANLIPSYGIQPGVRDFRPWALYDHPLTGAAATMLGLRLALRHQPAMRHQAYRLLLLAALISFGGRAALMVTLASTTLLSVHALARQAWRRRLGVGRGSTLRCRRSYKPSPICT